MTALLLQGINSKFQSSDYFIMSIIFFKKEATNTKGKVDVILKSQII
jgi:hypothetical protein